jgi:hypothetical protein
VKLAEFLLKLAADPDLLERFRAHPDAVADEYELDARQRRLLGPGQLERLRIEIHGELEVDEEKASIVWLYQVPSIPWLFKAPDDAA